MLLTWIKCLNCEKDTQVRQKEIDRGHGKFCSRICSSQFRIKNLAPLIPNVKCALCNKIFYLSQSKKDKSKSGLYFCCRAHKDQAQRIGGIREIMPSHYGITELNYRYIAFRIKPKICERCSYNENESTIIVHHIDRDRSNNDISNLEVLCCNCHAIEHWGESNET